MDEATTAEVTVFLDGLAESLISGDPQGISSCLAPWLGASAGSDLWAAIQDATADLDADTTGPPDTSELYDNPMTAAELREDTDLPAEITDENFAAWCCIAIRADEGASPVYDMWCAIVRTDAGLTVGFYEVEDAA